MPTTNSQVRPDRGDLGARDGNGGQLGVRAAQVPPRSRRFRRRAGGEGWGRVGVVHRLS